jgi:hypothetical protein
MKNLIKRFLKYIHPDLKMVKVIDEECWIYFKDGSKMVDREFEKDSETRYLLNLYKKKL